MTETQRAVIIFIWLAIFGFVIWFWMVPQYIMNSPGM